MVSSRLPQQLPWERSRTVWAQELSPLLSCPIVNGRLIQDVTLINGSVSVNHLLGRKLIGWIIVGIDAAATVHDTQASNKTPQLTLQLTSNAAATCSLWVF